MCSLYLAVNVVVLHIQASTWYRPRRDLASAGGVRDEDDVSEDVLESLNTALVYGRGTCSILEDRLQVTFLNEALRASHAPMYA